MSMTHDNFTVSTTCKTHSHSKHDLSCESRHIKKSERVVNDNFTVSTTCKTHSHSKHDLSCELRHIKKSERVVNQVILKSLKNLFKR